MWVAAAVAVAALVLGALALNAARDDDDGGPSRDQPAATADPRDLRPHPGATAEELALLPDRLPRAMLSTARNITSTGRPGDRTVTFDVAVSRSAQEELFVVGERMRANGWQVRPGPDGGPTSLSGYGWSGEAAPSGDHIAIRLSED